MKKHEKTMVFASQKLCFQGVKAIVSHRESYHFTLWKLCFHEKEDEKWWFLSFQKVIFLLDCVFSLTKLKRRNDKNVLFRTMDITRTTMPRWRGSISYGMVLNGISISNNDGPAINNQCGKALYMNHAEIGSHYLLIYQPTLFRQTDTQIRHEV